MNSLLMFQQATECYANLQSYSDKGLQIASWRGDHTTLSFQTHFIRPDRFRFDWKHQEADRIQSIWCNQDGIFSRLMTDRRFRLSSLQLALVCAAGLSNDLTRKVPSLLIPQAIESFVARQDDLVKNLCYLGTESIEGEDCHRFMQTQEGFRKQTTFWLSVSRSVLRKIVEIVDHNENRQGYLN